MTNPRMITFQGETKPLVWWAKQVGISEASLAQRIDKLQWPLEKALTKKRESRWDKKVQKVISTVGLRCSFCLKGILDNLGVTTKHRWNDDYGGYQVKYKCGPCNEMEQG